MLSTRHLEFLYRLSQMTQYYNHVGLSKTLKIGGKKISPQTFQNWFKTLREHEFNYYHSIIYEKIGLTHVFVVGNTFEPSVHAHASSSHRLSFCEDEWTASCPSTFCQTTLSHFLVPHTSLHAFLTTLSPECTYYTLYSKFCFHTPYHHSNWVGEQLIFNTGAASDYSAQLAKFWDYLSSLETLKDESLLKCDPLLAPLLFESQRDNLSSIQIWKAVKKCIGNDIGEYLKGASVDDNVGVKHIQKLIRRLNTDLAPLVLQIGFSLPSLFASTLSLAIIVDYPTKEAFHRFISLILPSMVRLDVYPNSTQALLFCHVQTSGLKTLTTMDLTSLDVHVVKAFYLTESAKEHGFAYCKVFDPHKGTWTSTEIRGAQSLKSPSPLRKKKIETDINY